MIDSPQDIVVTGYSAISAAGVGTAPLRDAVASGTSRLVPVPPEIAGMEGRLWGKTEAFKASDFMPPLKARKLDRCSLMAVGATKMALDAAALSLPLADPERVGIMLGCGFGGIANSAELLSGYFDAGVEGLAPMLFPNTVPNAAASNTSIEFGMQGPNVTIVQRFCSAESAVMMACRFLAEGRADVMVAGGVDELTPLILRAFREMGQHNSFAAGFGEGAGALVLETRAGAERRGAAIKGVIGPVRTIGFLPRGAEEDGMRRLLPELPAAALLSLSGTADLCAPLLARLPNRPRLEVHRITGRSLAMGGIALVALFESLEPGQAGLHLAASPQGPYFAIDVTGGTPA